MMGFLVKLFTNQNNYLMGYQNISVSLVQADIDAVKTAIATINSKLPFLIMLHPDEKKSLMKLGPKSADFVTDASIAVTSFPNILPPTFDKVEYGKDTALFKVLSEIKFQLDSVVEKIDDTHMAIGSEAMIASLEVYAYVQTARNRTPGLASVADKLKDRFKGQGQGKKKDKKENKS
jgi:hypothetical protein